MKQLFIFFCICPLLGGCSFSEVKYDYAISMVIDRTDVLELLPNEEDILNTTGLDADMWQGVYIEVSEISDMDASGHKIFVLPKENSLLGNPTARKAKVARFKNDLGQYLAAVQKQNTGALAHSIIWRTLANQLNDLGKMQAVHKSCLVCSDLMENSDVSFYSPCTFSLLQSDPKAVENELEKGCPIDTLQGVHICFLYKPANYDANKSYRIASTFFKSIFAGKGARVTVGTIVN